MSHAVRWAWMLALPLALPGYAVADAEDSGKVYQSVLKSIVWIHSPRDGGKVATGTGTLIDKPRRLVLTNYHVVGNNDRVTVLFPTYRDKKLVAERDFYRERLKREGGIRGKVMVRDKLRDLAIIQLDEVPDSAVAMALAPESVMPGNSVHSVGNPGDSGALWVYTPGKVRQVYHRKWKSRLGNDEMTFEADVVETDSATNPGDSGGPLVNDKSQLVGVTQGGSTTARLLSTFIDVSEVKVLLQSAAVRDIGTTVNSTREPDKTRTFEVRDGGKFFSEEAIRKANDDIRAIARKYDREILVETFREPPDGKAEKVAAMSAEERARFFREWANDRARAAKVNGLYVLICREPSHLYLESVGSARKVLDEAYTKKIVEKVLVKFREKKYDEGLDTAIDMVRDRLSDPIANP
jgi:hypothetical protein